MSTQANQPTAPHTPTPDRPYSAGPYEYSAGIYRVTRDFEDGGRSVTFFGSRAEAEHEARKLNDAHEAAAKAKRDADRVPALEAEVKRLREILRLAKPYINTSSAAGLHLYDQIRALTQSQPAAQPEAR